MPLVDLRAQYLAIRDEIDAAIQSVLDSTRFIGGPELASFEAEFAAYCEAEHCVGVSSGTSALSLALDACGVGPGDEVVTTTHTFVATAEAIAHAGATPVLVDVDAATGTISPQQVELALTGRTRAILPVHLYGHPADLAPLLELCRRYDLFLIEDAAQAHGARYGGRRVGSQGHLACFSFYPGKNLGAYGDAGAVVTSDANLAERVRMMADHGRLPGSKYEHARVGSNQRMDALQAAILRVKLRHLDGWNALRRARADQYDRLFAGSEAQPLRRPSWGESVYHLYVVRVPPTERERLQRRLTSAGIATGIHYPVPVHLQPAFAHLGYPLGTFPVAEALAATVLSLPLFPELEPSQVEFVADQVLQALREVDVGP
ncbi:MAG: DegT/DnrJ/EryC1/StrS family aminotransferase [Anaerolineae bacterium]|nr:DegT/DnrJ/EryC1/StrS family aminotransferase [Anaerolineae bacterium]